jgi:hypothetical protein
MGLLRVHPIAGDAWMINPTQNMRMVHFGAHLSPVSKPCPNIGEIGSTAFRYWIFWNGNSNIGNQTWHTGFFGGVGDFPAMFDDPRVWPPSDPIQLPRPWSRFCPRSMEDSKGWRIVLGFFGGDTVRFVFLRFISRCLAFATVSNYNFSFCIVFDTFLACSPSILHGICWILIFGTSTSHFAWYFATCWKFKRSCGFL